MPLPLVSTQLFRLQENLFIALVLAIHLMKFSSTVMLLLSYALVEFNFVIDFFIIFNKLIGPVDEVVLC